MDGALWPDLAAVAVTALVGAGAILQVLDPRPASPYGHLWMVAVLVAGARFGVGGAALTAAAAALVQAPALFAHVEATGLGATAVDDVLSCAMLLVVGPLVGVLAGDARRQRRRGALALGVQRAIAVDDTLPATLERLAWLLERELAPATVAVVARIGHEVVLAGGDRVVAGSVVAGVLAGGGPVFVPSATGGLRPLRVLVVPLVAQGETVGAIAVERTEDLSLADRAAVEALAINVALGLENARLAALQRRAAVELSEKVAAATRQLELADRAKSAFVAVASHELRTPLTALRGFGELLADRAMAPDEVRRVAAILKRETERLARIVENLLDLTRLERGLAPALAPRPIMPAEAIAAGVEIFHGGTHRVVIECAGTLPRVLADPDAIDRVLKNLVANAIKYSSRGSTVRVTARAAAGRVEIAVVDEGHGIPAAALPRLFEPYYRAPGSEGAPGTGLGLAVVKALVEAHGGTISVESALGEGTRVTIALAALP